MIPFFHLPWGTIPSFGVFCAIGLLSLVAGIHYSLRDCSCRGREEAFILPKIVVASAAGFISAATFDALCKWAEYGVLKPAGIAFYGGLIGATACICVLVKRREKDSSLSLEQWLDKLTLPFILFHIWGRIGCFFSGCCYGKPTESWLGVVFPDNAENGILHHGEKCYPTQLFEVIALILIFQLVKRKQGRFVWYLLFYSVARFLFEFFRGDDRGAKLLSFSPSQWVSLVLLPISIVWIFVKRKQNVERELRS